ncbi:hypothetical protein FJTKL_08060 [Diaporthe vaccinii]|uniref:Uncharacterized protein n=1 Tax=Diaporthe vaccinii TaxID=105482 RepID=A0ABR4FEC7_9PEZI
MIRCFRGSCSFVRNGSGIMSNIMSFRMLKPATEKNLLTGVIQCGSVNAPAWHRVVPRLRYGKAKEKGSAEGHDTAGTNPNDGCFHDPCRSGRCEEPCGLCRERQLIECLGKVVEWDWYTLITFSESHSDAF